MQAPRPLRGTIAVPGDKSISHRAVIMAALGRGKSRISGFLHAGDTHHTARIFQALGCEITGLEGGSEVTVAGRGRHGLREAVDILYTGNSGTTTRLLTGLLSAQPFFAVLSGDASLNRRPMGRITAPLTRMGARIWGRQNNAYPPLAIRGGPLTAICHQSPVASAQVKSAVLLAGLYADGRTVVQEPFLSRDHTERMFTALGIGIDTELDPQGRATITLTPPAADFPAADYQVPGDISAAAFFLVGALINPGSELTITGVNVNPTRAGILEALERMGADLRCENRRQLGGEPVADLTISHAGPLRGIEIAGGLIPRLIDELPVLALAASRAEGKTVIRDAAELRVKESDRLLAITRLLDLLGVATEPLPDGLVIHGREKFRPREPLRCATGHDHRIAMTALIAATALGRPIALDDPDCVATSFPEFSRLLARLRAA
ncbi:MAG: 3-phosphoshikimate 1-carboxyvinyltransferase [Deltaproteobacteria bacterium]|nr:3-phosphoshikimate 1-carboxyvinyltransferase [Deltaproteobacteria bacterium]